MTQTRTPQETRCQPPQKVDGAHRTAEPTELARRLHERVTELEVRGLGPSEVLAEMVPALPLLRQLRSVAATDEMNTLLVAYPGLHRLVRLLESYGKLMRASQGN